MKVLLTLLTDALLPSSVKTRSLNELLSWMLLRLPSKISTELLARRRAAIGAYGGVVGEQVVGDFVVVAVMLTPHAPRSLPVPNDCITLLPVKTFDMTRVAREVGTEVHTGRRPGRHRVDEGVVVSTAGEVEAVVRPDRLAAWVELHEDRSADSKPSSTM